MSYSRQTIMQQVKSFECFGFETHVKTLGEIAVIMRHETKIYKFADPDENIVITQLAHLYTKLKDTTNLT